MPDLALLALVAGAVAVGAVSAVSPFLPVEAYVAATALVQPPPVAQAVAAAAGLGQTLGKLAVLESARLAGRSPRLDRVRERALGRAACLLQPVDEGTVAVARGGTATATRPSLPATPLQGLARLSTTALRLLGGRAGPLVVLAAAAVSVPPLLVVAVCAGGSPMRRRAFVPACFVGRTARFGAIALLPGLLPA